MLKRLSVVILIALFATLLFVPSALADAGALLVYGDYQYSVNPDGTVTITGYAGAGGDITIPAQIDSKDVTAIGDGAFEGKVSLTGAVMPETLKTIGAMAFYGSGLRTVTVPEGVTAIGNNAFSTCRNLTAAWLSGSFTSLGSGVFYNCSSLCAIELPDGLSSIPVYTFCGCSALETVTIPDGVTSIGDWAFSQCGFESLTIPEGVVSIGDRAFFNCASLASISLPDSVMDIGDAAFLYCRSLGSISIPAGVTRIGEYTFSGCSSLKSVSLPSGLSSIGASAFNGCAALESVSVPAGVEEISAQAFYNCPALRNVNLAEGVVSIAREAFDGCSALGSVSFPSTVDSVGERAFGDCETLREAYFNGDAPSVFDDTAFSGCDPGFTVYYLDTSSGFSNPFHGYPAAVYGPLVTYTVSFDLNGAGGTPPAPQTVYRGVKARKPADPANNGYEFKGWYTESACENEWDFDSQGVAADTRLYAKWTPKKYSISYSLGGGSASGNPTEYTIEDPDITLNNPEKTGYIFDGWSGTGIDGVSAEVTIPSGSYGNRTYTAHWTAIDYTLTFHAQGGSDVPARTVHYGDSVSSPASTRAGYNFGGWYPTAGCDTEPVRFPYTVTGSAEFYAKWSPASYTVAFYPSGGKVSPVTKRVTYGSQYGALPLPSRKGYYFFGWYTKTSGQGTEITADSTVSITANAKLYAKWARNSAVALKTPKLYVKSLGYDSVKLSWGAVSGAKGYMVYRLIGKTYKLIATVDGALTYTDAGLTAGVKYKYKIRAYRVPYIATVYSSYSAVKSVKPVPSAPSGVVLSEDFPGCANVSWGAVEGAAMYEVYRSTSKTRGYVKLAATPETSYLNTGLTAGKTYYYRIRAYALSGGAKVYGSFSAAAGLKIISVS